MSDTNLNKTIKDRVPNLDDKELKSDKEDLQAICVDSGFLSGPLQTYYDSNENLETYTSREKEFPKEVKKEDNYIDSGCLASFSEQHLDSGINIKSDSQKPKELMKLKNDLNRDISEWFCDLSLCNTQPVNDLSLIRNNRSHNLTKINDSYLSTNSKNNSWETYYQQNADGDTQLHLAILSGFPDVTFALIRITPHPSLLNIRNDDCQSALHLGVLTGQPDVVRNLLLTGADATVRDAIGNTPLHTACICGDLEMVSILSKRLDITENQDKSKLSFNKNFRCAKFEPNLEIRNYDGQRCVHIAAEGNHIDVLRLLVACGADINAREGKSGKTVLHIAIENRNERLITFLLHECQKLNIEEPTYAGLTAYQLAALAQHEHLLTTLRKYGAEPLTPPESDEDSDYEDSQIYDSYGETFHFSSFNGGKAIHVA